MKRLYSRFRVFLLMTAIGLASVQFFNGLFERWTEKHRAGNSETVVYDFSQTPRITEPSFPFQYKQVDEKEFFQNRNLSLYDKGQDFSTSFVVLSKRRDYETRRSQGINFILEHWKSKKRGYVLYTWSGIDAYSETYIFIEPDDFGKWHIVLRSTGDTRYFTTIKETLGHSLKYRRTALSLSVLDKNGEEIDEL